MVYFTSWDINVFLCLLTYLPEDVVKRAVMVAKKTHEEFSLREAKSYWVANSPSLVRMDTRGQEDFQGNLRFKFFVPNDKDRGKTRLSVCRASTQNKIEFKKEWRLRSIELRKAKVVEWCKFGEERDQERHQKRLSKFCGNRSAGESRSEWIEKSKELNKIREKYTNNLWRSWEAGASSDYLVGWDRRVYVSQWYEGIHSGRFFLFYKQNKIIEERNWGVPKGPCEDGYVYPKTPIFDWGPYEQLIEDLRCIDGPGIGEPVGSKIEHIDDLFS